MDDVMRGKISGARDGGLADSDRAMRVAFPLDGRPTALSYGACYAGAKHEVVVGRVDDRVDILLDEITIDD